MAKLDPQEMNPAPRAGETPEQAQVRAAQAYAYYTNPAPLEDESETQAKARADLMAKFAAEYQTSLAQRPVAVTPPPPSPTAPSPLLPIINAAEKAGRKLEGRSTALALEHGVPAEVVEPVVAEQIQREENPKPPSSAYADMLDMVGKYGSEAASELQEGSISEVFTDKMQKMYEENPLAGVGVPLWWAANFTTTGWPLSEVMPGQKYTDRQWRALYEAQKRAVLLPTELADPKVREDAVFNNSDLYNFTVKAGTSAGDFSATRAWNVLKNRYITNHTDEGMSAEELQAVEERAGAWATDALLSARTFGGLNFPLESLPSEPAKYTATWSDLFSLDPKRQPKAWHDIGTALAPRVERAPGGKVWRQEGPFDYLFRLEQIPLTAAKEAMVQGTITPELSDVLQGTENMESFITEVVDSPEWQRDIQSNDPAVQTKAWLTLMAAGGVDVLFPTGIPIVGSAARFGKEIRLAQEAYRAALAAEDVSDVATAAQKAAAHMAALRTGANELELVRDLKAEYAGYRQGFKGKGSEIRAAYEASEAELAATRAEKAAQAEAAARESEVAAMVEDGFRSAEESEDPLAVAEKVKHRKIADDYLARVARNLASSDNVAAFLRQVGRDFPEVSTIGEIRALGGRERVQDVVTRLEDELVSLKAAFDRDDAVVKAAADEIKNLVKNVKDGDNTPVGAKIQAIRDRVSPVVKTRREAKRQIDEIAKALRGAEEYEARLGEATVEEAQRWLTVLRSRRTAVPAEMRTVDGVATAENAPPIPTAPPPSIQGASLSEKQIAILADMENVDDLLDTKGIGPDNVRAIAKALLEDMDLNGVAPETVLERALEFTDEELAQQIEALDQLAAKARGLDPFGPLGANLPSDPTRDFWDDALEIALARLDSDQIPEEELDEAARILRLLPLLTGQNFNTLLSRSANEQRIIRFGTSTADWNYRVAGEWYSVPTSYLTSVSNEVIAPVDRGRVWKHYVERKRYAVDNYMRHGTGFEAYVAPNAKIENPETLDAAHDAGELIGADKIEAPTWNAYFRRLSAQWGASKSGLDPTHVLTDDMVWIPNSPSAQAALDNLKAKGTPAMIPGKAVRPGANTRQVVIPSTGGAAPKIQPAQTIIQDYASIEATPATGFAARVRSVSADGKVELEILTFDRQGAPRPLPTGERLVLLANDLEFMERGRVPVDATNPMGRLRPKNEAELANVKGAQGIEYAGPSRDYLSGIYAPPENYTDPAQFSVYLGDLIQVLGRRDVKTTLRRIGGPGATPTVVPKPRLLPGEKQPGGGWASKTVAGERDWGGSVVDSFRKGYIRYDPGAGAGKVAKRADVPAAFNWKYKPEDVPLYESVRAFAEEADKNEVVRSFRLQDVQETGEDIPSEVLDLLVERISPHFQVSPLLVSVADRDRMITGGFRPVSRSEWVDLLYNDKLPVIVSRSGNELPISKLFPDEGALSRSLVDMNIALGEDASYARWHPLVRAQVPVPAGTILSGDDLLRGVENPQGLTPQAFEQSVPGLYMHMQDWLQGQGMVHPKAFAGKYLEEMQNFARSEREKQAQHLETLQTDPFLNKPEFIDSTKRTIENLDNVLAATLPPAEKRLAFAERKAQGAIHKERMLKARQERAARRVALREQGKLAPTAEASLQEQRQALHEVIPDLITQDEAGRAAMLKVVEDADLDEPTRLGLKLIIDRLPNKVARSVVLQFFEKTGVLPHGYTIPMYRTSGDAGRLVTLVGVGIETEREAAEVVIKLAHELTHALVPLLPPDIMADLRAAYAQHKAARKANSTMSRTLAAFLRRYTNKDEKFEEWLAWIVSDYVVSQKLPFEAASKVKGRLPKVARDIWEPLRQAFDVIRNASLNFVQRILGAGDVQKGVPRSVHAFVDQWYSPDAKVRADFNERLIDIYAEARKAGEEAKKAQVVESRAAKKIKDAEDEIVGGLESAAKQGKREMRRAERKVEEWEKAERKAQRAEAKKAREWLAEQEKAERELKAAKKSMARDATKLQEEAEALEKEVAGEGRQQDKLIQDARRKRLIGLKDEFKAAGHSDHKARSMAYLQVTKEELEAATRVARDPDRVRGADLRLAQLDYTDARAALEAAREARARIESLFHNDLKPRLADELLDQQGYREAKDAAVKAALEVPERPSMYRPPLTPVEAQVAERVQTNMARIGQMRDAPMTNTLLSRLAEGWAVQRGQANQTADHALVRLLGRSWTHSDDWATVAADMLARAGVLGVQREDVIEALKTLNLDEVQLLPAEVDHMRRLQASAQTLKLRDDVVPDEGVVATIQDLIRETNWKPRKESARMPGRHDLERTLLGLNAKVQHDVESAKKGFPAAISRLDKFMVAYLSPAREYMDKAMRKGLKDAMGAFSSRANQVNLILTEAARHTPQPGDLVRAISRELEGAQKAWEDSIAGGTMSNELFPLVVFAYADKVNIKDQDKIADALAGVIHQGTRENLPLEQIAANLYAETARQLKGQEHLLKDQVQGDLIFAKVFATQVIFHQAVRDTLGLGAVLDKSAFPSVKAWTDATFSSTRGLDYVLNVIDNPLDLRPQITSEYMLQVLGSLVTGRSQIADETMAGARRVFSEIGVENAKDASARIATEGKPFTPRAAWRHIHAAIQEATNTANPGYGTAFKNVFKQAVTVGFLDGSAGVVHHLGNVAGDAARINQERGFRAMLGSLRETLGVHLLLLPGLTFGAVVVTGRPLQEALRSLRTAMGEGWGKHLDAVLGVLSKHPDVPLVLEGRAGETYVDLTGRTWSHVEILEMAQRYAVPETFETDQIVRTIESYLKESRMPRRVRETLSALKDLPRDVASMIGQQRRMGLMLSFLDEGQNLEDAARLVSEVLLNYKHDLHPLDRNIIFNYLLPFWAFTKTNLRRTAVVAMSPSTWDGATLRLERGTEAGATALTEYATHDGRDEYGFCESDMSSEELKKWRAFRDSLRARGISYAEFQHMLKTGIREGYLDQNSRIARGVQRNNTIYWLDVEAQKFGFTTGEWVNFVHDYFMPDPSEFSASPVYDERVKVYFNLGRAEAGRILASGAQDAWGMVALPGSPVRLAFAQYFQTLLMAEGSYRLTTEYMSSIMDKYQGRGAQPSAKVQQAWEMLQQNTLKMAGDPDRSAVVNMAVSVMGVGQVQYRGEIVDSTVADLLPETWVDTDTKYVRIEGELVPITTWRVKPEKQAALDFLLQSGLMSTLSIAVKMGGPDVDPGFARYGVSPVNIIPYMGIRPKIVSEDRTLAGVERAANEAVGEAMQEADQGSMQDRKPPLTNVQLAQMERMKGENLYSRMTPAAQKAAMVRVISVLQSPQVESASAVLPLSRVALRVVGGLSEAEIDAMSQDQVFAAVRALTPPR